MPDTKYLTNPMEWLSFTDDSIDSYVALDREPFIDRRNGATIMRLGDGVTPGGQPVFNDPVTSISKPTIISPNDRVDGIDVQPIITASPFNGLNPDLSIPEHSGSYWEIATDSAFTNIVYSSGNTRVSLTTLDMVEQGYYLHYETQYYVRVKYVASNGIASEWGDTISFVTRGSWASQLVETLHASDGKSGDGFGDAVAISPNGEVAVIGACRYSDTLEDEGIVYLYIKDVNGNWVEHQRIQSTDRQSGDLFGSSLAISANGDTLSIGAYGVVNAYNGGRTGAIYVFTRNPATGLWVEYQKLTGDGVQASAIGYLKIAMSSNGSRIVAGDIGYDYPTGEVNGGRGLVYSLVNNVYVLETVLYVSDPLTGSAVGLCVSISANGKSILMTSKNNNLKQTAYLYLFDDVKWVEDTHFDPVNLLIGDQFGAISKLSADGNTAIVSAWGQVTLNGTGTVYIFRKDINTGKWVEVQRLNPSNTYSKLYGSDVDLSTDGNLIIISGNSNAVYTYRYSAISGQWSEVTEAILIDSTDMDASITLSMSGDGKVMLSGNSSDNDFTGATYIFN